MYGALSPGIVGTLLYPVEVIGRGSRKKKKKKKYGILLT
jgi:hypothetical protein